MYIYVTERIDVYCISVAYRKLVLVVMGQHFGALLLRCSLRGYHFRKMEFEIKYICSLAECIIWYHLSYCRLKEQTLLTMKQLSLEK